MIVNRRRTPDTVRSPITSNAAAEDVRTDRYKLVRFFELKQWEFIDLLKDRSEMNSVFGDKDYAEIQ